VVVCSRALINVAKEMERRYGIPYVEVSFFGSTETAKALRAIRDGLDRANRAGGMSGMNDVEALIAAEDRRLKERLAPYEHLRGKKAVLYTGGVKSWSLISALRDLGIEVVAVGAKKSTVEDERKMRELMGPDACAASGPQGGHADRRGQEQISRRQGRVSLRGCEPGAPRGLCGI
jgi:nitrogenase molybdenum-cofactor synthesis protein NifE